MSKINCIITSQNLSNIQFNPQPMTANNHEEIYIVKNFITQDTKEKLQTVLQNLVERSSANLKRKLIADGLSEEEIEKGIAEGKYIQKSREELLALLVESECGIGLTGGGDCAGIADFLSALALNLDPSLVMLGVKNAGAGLIVDPTEFKKGLIIVDKLLGKDFQGQSSTPYGSARVDAMKVNPENTMANIKSYKFVYGTGGDDHLGLLAKISAAFPEKTVAGTFKSIDGDGCIDDKPAQMLGFRTAMLKYQEDFWAEAQNAETHNQMHVVEFFGRKSGKLVFESARRFPKNFSELSHEEQRKITEFRDNIIILAPERPTSLRSIGEEARRIKDSQGNCVIAVAEGFLPPELSEEMNRLAQNEELKGKWQNGTKNTTDSTTNSSININEIHSLVTNQDLATLLKKNPRLAALFGETVWNSKLDSFGNVATLAGIRHFIIAAIQEFGEISKVNELLENYTARGATPCEYDSVMGQKIGGKIAEIINTGTVGGHAVVYLEDMDAMKDEPLVLPLKGISNKNTLNNAALYNDEMLRKNGVFWK